MTNDHSLEPGHAAQLENIASTLGVPVKAFFCSPASEAADEAFAVIRLWTAIADPPARRRILSLIRHEAARSGYVE